MFYIYNLFYKLEYSLNKIDPCFVCQLFVKKNAKLIKKCNIYSYDKFKIINSNIF